MNIKKKILLVEDDFTLLDNVTDILESENYEVFTAVDGEEGINKAYEFKPDMIICDIAIPLINGYEVLGELRKNEKTKQIPFIFLTAKVEKEDIRKGMQLGADDYIFKPFMISDLLNSINLRFEKISGRNYETFYKKEFEKNKFDIGDKLLINNFGKPHYFNLIDLKFLRVEAPYIKFKFGNTKNILQRDTLNNWEKRLPSKYFIRIHRSTIINTEFIVRIEKMNKSSYLIWIKEEEEPFVVSKRFSSKIRKQFV